ncbi:hypothetical protein HAX54_023129, partial [Datura stramonium]|nr:hypothetical protein [Datura stramonium]
DSKTDSSRVSLSRWIGFWYKKALRYKPAPPRREKKTAHLKFMHNPTGAIPEISQWSRDEEGVFSKLGVRPAKKEETYLATFLSYWLCAFVLSSEEGDFIRPETFKMATMMATKRKISLAVPVLARIYSGLSKISQSSQLDLVRIRFPIHYVYGWLAHYFKTHYAFANEPSNPPMVAFSGEGVARYYDKKKIRKCIRQGDNIAWASTMLNNYDPYDYIDNNDAPKLELNYFTSIRFGYLCLRNGNSIIIETYIPHRFSRQFGFYQKIPGVSSYNNRSASLDEGLRYWRICVLHRSMSHATFPPVTSNVKKLFANDYKTWWLKTHGNFLDSYLQTLVDVAEPISIKISEVVPQECSNATPKTDNSSASMGGKGYFPLRDADLAVLEIPESVDSPSRTLTVPFKELNYAGALLRGGSQESGESVYGPNLIKSSSVVVECDSGKLSGSDVDCASSLKEEVQVILEDMDGKDVDVSPLMRLMKSFFELAAIYDHARSTLHDKDMKVARKELSIAAGERLSNVMFEEHEKIEKVSSIRQSLSEVKEEIEKLRRKEKDLEVLLEATKKEIEEAKLGVSIAEKDFDACNDADLLNDDDLTDLEQKRERLEAMCQDLINYKLCLD